MLAHTGSVAANTMARAAILADRNACFSGKTIIAFTDTNVITLAVSVAITVTWTKFYIARVTAITWAANTLVIDTLADWRSAIVGTGHDLTSDTIVARLAEACAINALTVSRTSGWAQLGA